MTDLNKLQAIKEAVNMSFIEFETWQIKEGNEAAHDEMIRQWFAFVRQHHAELFAEWKSARYFRQTDRDGNPTGTYIMLFEFYSREAHHAYKERRKNWSGPYAAYKAVDPYQFFKLETVTTEYWEPQETEAWFSFE
ncbi:MAG: hypothetical protein KDE56_25145 [Anaerolineales bacterium]|nr:hypothetical protein [Anaerolineales bacterium]